MKKHVKPRDIAIVIGAAVAWTLVVVAFSTSMGERPLRMYDWGPPVFACIITLGIMFRDRQG